MPLRAEMSAAGQQRLAVRTWAKTHLPAPPILSRHMDPRRPNSRGGTAAGQVSR
jgi:hypothetical protein